MNEVQLVAETNELLKQLIELHREKRENAEAAKKEFDELQAESKRERERRTTTSLIERGVPEHEAGLPDSELEARREKALASQKLNLAELQERERQHRADVLAEIQAQTELLRRIAEKLEA